MERKTHTQIKIFTATDRKELASLVNDFCLDRDITDIQYITFSKNTLLTSDSSTESIKSQIDILVTAVYLIDITDYACTLC